MKSLLVSCALFATLTLQSACAQKAGRQASMQGICGTVTVKRGNMMPGPGKNTDGQPVEREVLIYPLLNATNVDMGERGFINSVRDAKPVNIIQSDANGKFCVDLPVGKYSVLVREPKGLYANLSDTQNNIFPVEVRKNQKETVRVDITHEAAF